MNDMTLVKEDSRQNRLTDSHFECTHGLALNQLVSFRYLLRCFVEKI